MITTFETDIIGEGTTGELTLTSDGSTVTFLDKDGSPIPLTSMVSITATMIETITGNTVNSRTAQDVMNANNGTYHATSGLFTLDLQPGDTAIVNTNLPIGGIEIHRLTLTFVWDSSAEQLSIEILLKIRNLRSAPQS